MKTKLTIFLFCLIFLANHSALALEAVNLTTELMESPVALAEKTPRFGWQIMSDKNNVMQSAYAIEVFETTNGKDRIYWKSGKVRSSESQLIPYSGTNPLIAGKKYNWRVKTWDNKNKSSKWSKITSFRMAPDDDFLNANWIGSISRKDANLPSGRGFHSTEMRNPEKRALWAQVNPLSNKSIYLRQSFETNKKIAEALVHVSGLGLYELSINGNKIGESEFAPLLSDYDKTVYFNTFDVTENLVSGENALGVLLGNGFYNVQGGRYRKLLISFGPPTLFLKLSIRYTDGSAKEIVSDKNWKFSYSPITFNCMYGGEDYDATREQKGWDKPGFDDSKWLPVVVQEAPKGILRPQQTTPVKIMERYSIRKTTKLADKKYVLDMGQNLSGFPEINVSGNKGDTIRLTPGESLNEDGSVSQKQTGSKHYYEYILSGNGDETWHPRFSYYGYRYIQVEGAVMKDDRLSSSKTPVLKNIVSCFIYNSAKNISSFESSNKIFNDAHYIIGKAVRSNMQAVFTDCPHREKLGWLEQVHLNGPGLYYNYDLRTYIPKVMQDISDAQLPNGLVPSIAPEYVEFDGAFRDSPEWGSTSVIGPWMYYENYRDNSLIVKHYDVMKKYVDYLTSTAKNHIVYHGLGDWYDYHSEKAGFSKNTPIPLVATAHYYWDLILLAKSAKMVGNKADELRYNALAQQVKSAFNNEFFDETTHQYGSGSQASNAIPLFLDMVDSNNKKPLLDNLVKDIQKHGNKLTTGDVGNRFLFQTLAQNGLNELMYTMHNHEDVPGYGYQIKFGATTLTEQWNPSFGTSWNHFMMGQIDEWFFKWLAGIQFDPKNPGYKKIIINPQIVGDLNYVSASTESLYGKISVDWKRENGLFNLKVNIPANTEAMVILPNKTTQSVGSGTHTFSVKL